MSDCASVSYKELSNYTPDSKNEGNSLYSRLRGVLKSITVEPVIFFYLLTWTLQGALTTNLLHDKVCSVQYGLDIADCQDLSDRNEEDDVQRSVSQLNMYLKLIQNIPSVLFVLFLGSWSDKNGRKIPLLLPLFGSFLASLICTMNSYFWWLAPEHILMAAVPRAMTGGSISIMMASYSYISDISGHHSRTTRISMVDLMFIFSSPAGFYLSDVLYTCMGYTGVYSISSCIFIVLIVYVVIAIRETRGSLARIGNYSSVQEGRRNLQEFENDNQIRDADNTIKNRMRSDWQRHMLKPRVLLLMINICLINITFGTVALDYLFVKKRFSWTYSQFVHLCFVKYFLVGFGSSIILPVLSLKFQADEYILGTVGCMSKLSGSLIQAFAFNPWHLYLACSTSCLEGIPLSVTRSKISKLVPSKDLGKTFSVIACWECVAPLISTPLFTFTYNATLDVFPGTIYLITGSIIAFAALVFISLLLESIMHQTPEGITQDINPNIKEKLIPADEIESCTSYNCM